MEGICDQGEGLGIEASRDLGDEKGYGDGDDGSEAVFSGDVEMFHFGRRGSGMNEFQMVGWGPTANRGFLGLQIDVALAICIDRAVRPYRIRAEKRSKVIEAGRSDQDAMRINVCGGFACGFDCGCWQIKRKGTTPMSKLDVE